MVKLQVEWMLRDGGSLIAYELAIVAAIGKIIRFKAMIHNDSQLDLQDKISGHRVKIRLRLSFWKDRFDRQKVSTVNPRFTGPLGGKELGPVNREAR